MIDVLILGLLTLPSLPVVDGQGPQVIVLEARADATLVEHPAGLSANGTGPYLSVGRTSQTSQFRRRAVLRFDVAEAVPAGARIEDATLVMYASQGGDPEVVVSLHRLLHSWHEGPSFATGGQGVPSMAGDVTWVHRSYPDLLWSRPGGDFRAVPSAAQVVDGIGLHAWNGHPHLVNDVRLWLRSPGRDHGWLVLGDEEQEGGAVRFGARENPDPLQRPQLEVRYSLSGQR